MKGALLVLPGVSIAKESNSAARDRSFEALHIGMEILIVFKNTLTLPRPRPERYLISSTLSGTIFLKSLKSFSCD